jgi:hypothetical protein
LTKENNVNDTLGINYLAKFLNYYCPNGNNIAQLNAQGKQAVLSIFESESEFIKKAINTCNCSR